MRSGIKKTGAIIQILCNSFSKYCAIEKYGILKINTTAILRDNGERKYKTEKLFLNFVYVGFY